MLEGFKFSDSVHARKVATKIFNNANLRDILYFKLAVNTPIHHRSWKTDKKGIQFCLRRKERCVQVIQVRFLLVLNDFSV